MDISISLLTKKSTTKPMQVSGTLLTSPPTPACDALHRFRAAPAAEPGPEEGHGLPKTHGPVCVARFVWRKLEVGWLLCFVFAWGPFFLCKKLEVGCFFCCPSFSNRN